MVVILLYQLPYGIQVIMMTKAVRAIVASICSGDIYIIIVGYRIHT